MRKAMLFLALLGFASLLWAQDPSLGTWKLNLTKSKIPSQNAANLKESVIVMRAIDANTYESISTDTTKDGKTSVTKWTVPITGGIQKYQQGGPAAGISILAAKIDPYSIINIYLQDGKQIGIMQLNISKDGKTMSGSATYPDEKGKITEWHWQFEKQ